MVSFTKEPERSRGPSHWGLYSNSVVFAAPSCVCLSLSIKKANSGTQGLRLLYRFDSIVNRRETNKQKPALLSLESHPSCSLRAGFLGCSLLRLLALGQCLGRCKWLETTGWKEKTTPAQCPWESSLHLTPVSLVPSPVLVPSMNAGSLSQVRRCLFLLLVQQCRSQALQ